MSRDSLRVVGLVVLVIGFLAFRVVVEGDWNLGGLVGFGGVCAVAGIGLVIYERRKKRSTRPPRAYRPFWAKD
ncbi:hypothetical protein [Aeromicrobium alkaliterrae]|uniref:LPXTG cell wall anchor domain-containing protein n=1 Tax=Aeromicrobium alkaliterrae TaxID=302168 RepID=A0ABN2K9E2_9ACTN